MPQIITDENDALDALRLMTAPAVDPAIDEANELLPLLRQCVRATLWVAVTTYAIGATVQPTAANRNGRRYVLISTDGSGRQSGATEPTWPVSDNATVGDGNLIWREAGLDYDCLWDLEAAAAKAWQLKIDKVSCQYDFSVAGASDHMSQKIATLERQRDKHVRPFVL